MGRKHLLPITAPLHRFQNGLKIAANQPYPRARRFRQTHLLKHKQPGIDMLFPRSAGTFSGAADNEMFRVRSRLRHLNRVRPVDRPVERRESPLFNLAAF